MGERNSAGLPVNSFRDGDPRLIDITEPTERAYWCKCLGVSEKELITLVGTVGNTAQRVKEALGSAPPDPAGAS